jgi:signal transduction histidine kinase
MNSQTAYALLGLTAVVAVLVSLLAYAMLRFFAAARGIRQQARETGERTFVTSALEEAVTRLKSQEQSMAARAEASERLSDEIMASLASGLLVVGLDGRVRVLNPAGARLLDLPEIPGGLHRDALAASAPLADLIDCCLATGEALPRQTVRVDYPDRGTRHFGVSVSPLRDGKGSLRGAICLLTDLTQVIGLEEQLRLKDSLARVGELTAGLAHEFRNGLATIHGYGRLIHPANVPEAYRPYVQGIRDETDALGQVVSNFLVFARPAALALVPVHLGAVVARAVCESRGEAASRGGQIAVEGAFGIVRGDEMLLGQVFDNLLRNALEACAQAQVPPAIRVEGELDEAQPLVRIRVTDNGAGIEPAVQHRLFTPFFTTKAHGTGMGLALVQKIVVSHDGRIVATAAAGGGACFEIELPLAPAPNGVGSN